MQWWNIAKIPPNGFMLARTLTGKSDLVGVDCVCALKVDFLPRDPPQKLCMKGTTALFLQKAGQTSIGIFRVGESIQGGEG